MIAVFMADSARGHPNTLMRWNPRLALKPSRGINLNIMIRHNRLVLPKPTKSSVEMFSRAAQSAQSLASAEGTGLVTGRGSAYNSRRSGRGAVWLARLNGVQEVGGSNPLAPTCKARRDQKLRRAFCVYSFLRRVLSSS